MPNIDNKQTFIKNHTLFFYNRSIVGSRLLPKNFKPSHKKKNLDQSLSSNSNGCGSRTRTYDLRVMSCEIHQKHLLHKPFQCYSAHVSQNPEGQKSIKSNFSAATFPNLGQNLGQTPNHHSNFE